MNFAECAVLGRSNGEWHGRQAERKAFENLVEHDGKLIVRFASKKNWFKT